MKKSISIIGGGSASLFLAAFLDPELFELTIYEKNKTLGRKFLVAGKGGFNLTHSEDMDTFIERYTPISFLKEALLAFDNQHFRQWLSEIGIPTFIGSSKRVFPEKGIKPIEVLNAIIAVLKEKKVKFQFQYEWTGWGKKGETCFNENIFVNSDYYVFALGGGSWKKTGSTGNWLDIFEAKGIKTKPFQAANCAFEIAWPADFMARNAGSPLKNITISCGSKSQKGEVVITSFGLEGNAIYALSPQIQDALKLQGKATIFVDLKPKLAVQEVINRISSSKEVIKTKILRDRLRLSQAQINLIKSVLSKEEFLSTEILANKIKKLPLTVIAAAPVDDAISTSGGIELENVNKYFEIKKMKNTFCIGEMLDWNAPTGGYLLQGCFSMGAFLAHYLNHKK